MTTAGPTRWRYVAPTQDRIPLLFGVVIVGSNTSAVAAMACVFATLLAHSALTFFPVPQHIAHFSDTSTDIPWMCV